MQGAVIFFMIEIGLVISLSLMFCAFYCFYDWHRNREDDDTEDDLGYLRYLVDEEVKS